MDITSAEIDLLRARARELAGVARAEDLGTLVGMAKDEDFAELKNELVGLKKKSDQLELSAEASWLSILLMELVRAFATEYL